MQNRSMEARLQAPWSGFVRKYASYDQYVDHQRSKLDQADARLLQWDATFRETLRGRLQTVPDVKRGARVLCLASRLGGEVRAFIDCGCFAVGIDLNPGALNSWVIAGDFHAIQFADGSVDIVYTNALDHALDLPRLAAQVSRVLAPNGVFIVEAVAGIKEGWDPSFYECRAWDRVEDLVQEISAHGFHVTHRSPITKPWPGEHVHFRVTAPRTA